MDDDRKNGSEKENDKELSLWSALDEIGFARPGGRLIIGRRTERKSLIVRRVALDPTGEMNDKEPLEGDLSLAHSEWPLAPIPAI